MRQILELIDQLDNLVYEARSGPFSNAVKVDPDRVFGLLDEMRAHLNEKPDFGDETAEHEKVALRRVAEQLEALEDERRPVPPPLTAAASDQVRGIVETAERAAGELRDEAKEMTGDAERRLAEAKEVSEKLRAQAEEEAQRLRAEAAQVREQADAQAARVIAQAERIRSEASRSAAALSGEQMVRMEEAAAKLSESAGRASGDFDALLESLREPATALADLLGPAVQALTEEVGSLRERVAAADAPIRSFGEVKAEPVAAETQGDAEGFGLDELPGQDDPIAAFRIEGSPAPESEAEEPDDEDGPNVIADPADTGDLGAEEIWRG
jgi:hypothetical protein